ncbi:MAG: LLM class flavin-dependent oxidoreductase [Phototrophicaceae bacterium]
MNFTIGVMFRCTLPPQALKSFAQQTEQGGFDALWLVEDCFFSGGIATVSTALAVTDSLTIGLGIMPAVGRNVAMLALEISALANMYPNRFIAGIGHGVGAWMKQIGAFPPSQLKALEEVTVATRSLLSGEKVTMHGQTVNIDGVQLIFPPQIIPPLVLGVRGQKSLTIAGKVANGAILAEIHTVEYVAWARQQIEQGRTQAQREDPYELVVYNFCSIHENKQVAVDRLRPIVADFIAGGELYSALDTLGISEEVRTILAQGGATALSQSMPNEWIEALTWVGSVEECAQAIRKTVAAGATSIVLVPPPNYEQEALTLYQELLNLLR